MGLLNKEKFRLRELSRKKKKADKKLSKVHTILLVDDEKQNLSVLTKLLNEEYNLLLAKDGQQALEIIQQEQKRKDIHLVVTDQRMPRLTGVEFLEHCLDLIPQAKRIILSGYSDIDVIIHAINKIQVYRFILKPFEPEDFLLTIQRALETFDLEESLRENQQRLKRLSDIVANTSDFVGYADPDGEVLYINPAGRIMLGYGEEDVKGTKISQYHPEWVQKILFDEGIPTVKEKGIWKFDESALITKGGKEISASQVLLCHKDDNGKIESLSTIIRDMTERKNLEAQLRQAQKMEALGTLAGGIAHDFNNILGTIIGNVEMCMLSLPQNDERLRYLEPILNAGERAAGLIRQILTFSRMESASFQPVGLSALIEEILTIMRATLPGNITIQKNLSQDCPQIMADPTQIHQVILNLFTNAYQAMEEKGGILEITLKVLDEYPSSLRVKNGQYLQLIVKDTGHGIPPEILERIFDPFFTTKEADKGTGLGLSMVHGIIEKHQGNIEVESQINEGTRFSIYFPVAEEKIVEESIDKIEIRKSSGSILVVEDESTIADLYQKFLEDQGYSVMIRNNGLDALALFKEQPDQFDLVLTDQVMPHMTGKQLSEKILRIRPNLPILLFTGYNNSINREEAKKLGIWEYIFKPVKLNVLQQIIEKCLRRKF